MSAIGRERTLVCPENSAWLRKSYRDCIKPMLPPPAAALISGKLVRAAFIATRRTNGIGRQFF